MKLVLLLSTIFFSTLAFAAATHECGHLDSIGNLVGSTKSFDNVRVAYVSTEEPAVAPDHILIFIYDLQMGQSCTAISRDAEGNGFGFVEMTSLKMISYDPQKGRLLQINVKHPNREDRRGRVEKLRFRANDQTGKVTIE